MIEGGNAAAVQGNGNDGASDSSLLRWEQVRDLLRREYGDTVFRSWIAPVTFRSFNGGIIEVAVPTRFLRDWVKGHYADRIRALWAQHFCPVSLVEVVVDARKEGTVAAVAAPELPVANENAQEPVKTPDDVSSPLDVRFTFSNFVTGPSNELAHAAARKVADGAAVSFNPLYLHGGVGLGKTHLMHAIAWAIRQSQPQRRVVYMSAEKFMYQFVRALRANETMSFKEAFRSVDVLMIDDIQFICGKAATQQEFFHTFNALIDQGKQVVVSADRSPSCLDGIDERLRSRLGGGLAADIGPADADLRLRILRSKCALLGRMVPEEVLAFLAEKIVSSVRELEGALNRLIAHAELAGRPLSVAGAEEILQDLLRAGDRRTTVEDIQKKVAGHYNIRLTDMHSPRRARPVARPRQVAMYLCKALTEHSLPEIGRKFGGRDHTTIMHGVRKVEELMAADPSFRQDVETLKRAIAG